MILDWLDAAAQGDSGVQTATGFVSWAAVAEREAALSAWLVGQGIGVGDRVAILCLNRPDYIAAYLSAIRLGAVLVPLNTRNRSTELAWLLDDAGASVLLVDEDLEGHAPMPAMRLDAIPSASAPVAADPDPHRPAVQMYTSGTTGRPKGALLSEDNLVALVGSWLEEMPLEPQHRTLQVTPLFHVGALMMVLCNLSAASTLCLPLEFKPADAMSWLAEQQVSHTLLVPAMIRWMLMQPGARERSYPALQTVVYGASPIPAALLSEALETFGCDFLQGYGLTETAGVVTVLRAPDHAVESRLTSAGQPLSCNEIRVVDTHDVDCAVGEVGEVVCRGRNITAGYHNRPEATEESLRGGWFHTGDAGYLDAEGYLFLVDRLKDMIIVGGENVYPSEVERVLSEAPEVEESSVIGVPHGVWGESVLAVVVLSGDHDETVGRRLIRHCRASLARFKCPTRVVFIDALPRNAAGKVDKASLRAPHWEGHDRAI